MNSIIKSLFELQKLDAKVLEIKQLIEAMKARLIPVKKDVIKAIDELKDITEAVEKAELEKKRLELDIGKEESSILKYKSQLLDVKSQKEYDALEHEISHLEEKKSACEDRVLELLDFLEVSKGKIHNLRGLKKKRKADYEAIKDDVKLKIIAQKNGIEEELRQLKELRKSVDESVLSVYEKIAQKYPGDALSAIKNTPSIGYTCSGCRINLPPHVYQEVNESDGLVRCENCSRILYTTDDE